MEKVKSLVMLSTANNKHSTRPCWPPGTVVDVSSYHSPNYTSDGERRTYSGSNVIDGDDSTFWNDNTHYEFPDVLHITSPTPVTLSGISVLSHVDGVVVSFKIEVRQDDGSWVEASRITGNRELKIQAAFQNSFTTNSVRIEVTQAIGGYTRIAAVWPGMVY
jgi:hypothetical protein